ncbi:hypothetical protein JTE90_017636 [Oedothorax gibbosus]|uniref:Regulatory protein zeste n=1 Tax=Oedothorax gibbosus TaxID=931172 RepID=A0AAV6U9A6_9ARAC|nr:hypothetical protein JTE90_017636 [Oedothorax gibbosus]
MSRIVGKRISRSQLEKIADFLEKYPQLSKGSSSSVKSVQNGYKAKLWRQLANILNAEPFGAKKSSLKWRKCLRDYKCSVKKKYLHFLADSSNLSPLTYLDVRYLAMMGYVVDVERVELANKDDEQPSLENTGNLVTEDIVRKKKEPEQKFYRAPEIITILPKNYAPTTFNQLLTDQSKVKEDAHETIQRPIIKLPTNVERPSIKLQPNVEIPESNELSNVERDQNKKPTEVDRSKKNELSIDEFTSNENTGARPQSSANKKSSLAKKMSGVKEKNETAVALHAIARELNAKNELTKRKIELEKEKLQLEKRKIEAFELIAKRLCRK